MRMTPDQKNAARAAIVARAGERFREAGLSGIGIDALAAACGQTSGAIYAHFKSKTNVFEAVVTDGLNRLVAGVERVRAGAEAKGVKPWVLVFVDTYLSAEHRTAIARGCLLPSLSADIARAPAPIRALYTAKVEEAAQALAEGVTSNDRLATAHALLALCAGALTLSRAAEDGAVAEKLLADARANARRLMC